MHDMIHYVLGGFSGVIVGFTLGLVGGGGSILAVPLMVYLVGVKSPHIAIGTSALAVAVNAATGLINHVRAGNVIWRCGFVYAAAGVIGALAGSTMGKAFDGQKLLFLFALLMLVVAFAMYRDRKDEGIEGAACNSENWQKVSGFGLGTGILSGFFGIGGGFLIVPGLVKSTHMPIVKAVGTSLIAVCAFGLTTAANYAFSGLIDWSLAALFIGGGILGGVFGTMLSNKLAETKGQLNTAFATLVVFVALYMLYRSSSVLFT
jgi:hypothetical protein